MDIVLVLALLVFARLVVSFFGVLAVSTAGSWYLNATRAIVPPIIGAWSVRSPYGGVFSVDAGIVIVVLLVIEWLVAVASARPAPSGSRRARG
jgi:hypothetical protein